MLKVCSGLHCLLTVYSGSSLSAPVYSGSSQSANRLIKPSLSVYSLLRAFTVFLLSNQVLHWIYTVYSGPSLSSYMLLRAFIIRLQSNQGLHYLFTVCSGVSLSAYSLLCVITVCLTSTQGLPCLYTGSQGNHFLLTVHWRPSKSSYRLFRALLFAYNYPGHSLSAFNLPKPFSCSQSSKGLHCLLTVSSGLSLSALFSFYSALKHWFSAYNIRMVFNVCLPSTQGLNCLFSTQCLHCLLTVYSGPSLSAYCILKALTNCLLFTQDLKCLLTVYSRPLLTAYCLLRAFIVCLLYTQGPY